MNIVGGSHLLNALGVNAQFLFAQVTHTQRQTQSLHTLVNDFGATAGFMNPAMLAQMLQTGGIPAGAQMMPPPWGHCACPGSYAMPRTFDFGASPFGNPIQRMMARRSGARLERLLERNPFARAQAEMMLGGRILPDGIRDGRITIQPFAPGFFPAGGAGNMAAAHAMNALNQVNYGAGFGHGYQTGMQQAGNLFGGFDNMIKNALGNLMQQMMGMNPFGGAGGAGGAGGGNPAGGALPAGQTQKWADPVGGKPGDDISAILNDPALTVEDQVVLMLMKIAKQFDKQIKQQADYVNKIQQKAQKGGNQGDAPSIDVETMKLKRLIDKRSQMFDMLRQIIDKYNQTAKNMIDSLGR